jgi:putative membrane protein
MDRRLLLFFSLLVPVLVWSWLAPFDRFTWWLEAAPVLVAAGLIAGLRLRFPLSSLLLVLAWLHGVILLVGAHYSYARVPAFDALSAALGWTRNNFDKLGHFVQGFVPAILVRELLLRTSPLGVRHNGQLSRWLGFLVVAVCLAFSAVYELIEWWVAEWSGADAEAFLGTQGYVWDTQSDMVFALIGAGCALLALARRHDRSLAKVLAGLDRLGQ